MMFSTFPTVVRAQLWPRIGAASLLENGPVLESVVCMALGPGSIRARMRRIVVIVTVIVVVVVAASLIGGRLGTLAVGRVASG